MKLTMKITSDTKNSAPTAELVFEFIGESIYIKLTDDDREISIKQSDLKKVAMFV